MIEEENYTNSDFTDTVIPDGPGAVLPDWPELALPSFKFDGLIYGTKIDETLV